LAEIARILNHRGVPLGWCPKWAHDAVANVTNIMKDPRQCPKKRGGQIQEISLAGLSPAVYLLKIIATGTETEKIYKITKQ